MLSFMPSRAIVEEDITRLLTAILATRDLLGETISDEGQDYSSDYGDGDFSGHTAFEDASSQNLGRGVLCPGSIFDIKCVGTHRLRLTRINHAL